MEEVEQTKLTMSRRRNRMDAVKGAFKEIQQRRELELARSSARVPSQCKNYPSWTISRPVDFAFAANHFQRSSGCCSSPISLFSVLGRVAKKGHGSVLGKLNSPRDKSSGRTTYNLIESSLGSTCSQSIITFAEFIPSVTLKNRGLRWKAFCNFSDKLNTDMCSIYLWGVVYLDIYSRRVRLLDIWAPCFYARWKFPLKIYSIIFQCNVTRFIFTRAKVFVAFK